MGSIKHIQKSCVFKFAMGRCICIYIYIFIDSVAIRSFWDASYHIPSKSFKELNTHVQTTQVLRQPTSEGETLADELHHCIFFGSFSMIERSFL